VLLVSGANKLIKIEKLVEVVPECDESEHKRKKKEVANAEITA
jgi:hypothetical protein